MNTQQIHRKKTRGKTLIRDLSRVAGILDVTPQHLGYVVRGERSSPRLMERYEALREAEAKIHAELKAKWNAKERAA